MQSTYDNAQEGPQHIPSMVRRVKQTMTKQYTYEPRHDKTNKLSERPAKTQISLGIRPV